MKLHTKESLISDFKEINSSGWIANYRSTSSGNVGNVLEDLLEIEENNLQLPDAGEWEIKAQKVKLQPSSLLTLFHCEPEPRDLKVVPYLVENYGWEPTVWKSNYSETEKSFRQTLTNNWSDRGFKTFVSDRIDVLFNKSKITNSSNWTYTENSFITPYWTFETLHEKLHKKLKNCFYVQAVSKYINDSEHFKYCDVVSLEGFSFDNFLREVSIGNIFIDFNARTGHNHGTSFRTRQNILPKLYSKITQII